MTLFLITEVVKGLTIMLSLGIFWVVLGVLFDAG